MIKCPKHPNYKGVRKPKMLPKKNNSGCYCYEIWQARLNNLNLTWIINSDGTKILVEG